MFGRRKLTEDHKFLIDALAKELKQDKDEVLSYVLEMGFTKIRVGTESPEVINNVFDVLKKDNYFMKISRLLTNWWNQGQNP